MDILQLCDGFRPGCADPLGGESFMAALAMALSGMALTVAGAFTSLFAKSKH